MEHGRIEIQYTPDLPEDDQLALKGVFDAGSRRDRCCSRTPEMPYDVAVTAWTSCSAARPTTARATLDAIRDFRDTYRGHGPEPLPMTVSG